MKFNDIIKSPGVYRSDAFAEHIIVLRPGVYCREFNGQRSHSNDTLNATTFTRTPHSIAQYAALPWDSNGSWGNKSPDPFIDAPKLLLTYNEAIKHVGVYEFWTDFPTNNHRTTDKALLIVRPGNDIFLASEANPARSVRGTWTNWAFKLDPGLSIYAFGEELADKPEPKHDTTRVKRAPKLKPLKLRNTRRLLLV